MILLCAAGPAVENAAAGVASGAAVAEQGVAFFAAHAFVAAVVAEHAVVSVALASVAGVAERQASVDIAPVFDVSVPVSVLQVEAYNLGCPTFPVVPSTGYYASSSNSVEVAGLKYVHSSTGAHANHGLCNTFSSPDLCQNKN